MKFKTRYGIVDTTDMDVNSMYAHQIRGFSGPRLAFELNDSFEHEGTTWYQLVVNKGCIGGWIEKHDDELWWENTPEWKNTRHSLLYTVHERLYTYICLKWGNTNA